MNRRGFITSSASLALLGGLTGCLANDAVVQSYSEGRTLYGEANSTASQAAEMKDAGNTEGAQNEYGAASSLFDSAADSFEEARDAANTEDARFYSEEAMNRARAKARQMADLSNGNTRESLSHTGTWKNTTTQALRRSKPNQVEASRSELPKPTLDARPVPQPENGRVRDFLNRGRVHVVAGALDVLFRLDEVPKRGIDHFRARRIVFGAGGDDLGGSVELSFPLVGQLEAGSVGHVVKGMHRGPNPAVPELLNESVLMNGGRGVVQAGRADERFHADRPPNPSL
ncbi:hypothetical protein K6T25_04230 [Halobaculum rubrum]|nr:hypothetical protein [Halobaculum rubrum]QZY00312.1 hypothetical protein K6T25_04230 [Halobaculum rubrum]